MSYGCAKRRDERRNAALPRLEQALASAEKAFKAAVVKAKSKEAKDLADQALWLAKVGTLQMCLDNTRANLGKGTQAMNKRSQQVDYTGGID